MIEDYYLRLLSEKAGNNLLRMHCQQIQDVFSSPTPVQHPSSAVYILRAISVLPISNRIVAGATVAY